MPDEAKPVDRETPKDSADVAPSERGWGKRRLARWFGSVAIGAVVVLVLSIGYRGIGAETEPEMTLGGEVTLGEFRFLGSPNSSGSVARAEFRLHIRFLDGLERTARHKMSQRQFRVQQDVEQLLRQARDQDFADPELSELKRELQETINAALDLRAVSEVLITDFAAEGMQFAIPDVSGGSLDQADLTIQ